MVECDEDYAVRSGRGDRRRSRAAEAPVVGWDPSGDLRTDTGILAFTGEGGHAATTSLGTRARALLILRRAC
jgi:hypothetical protein